MDEVSQSLQARETMERRINAAETLLKEKEDPINTKTLPKEKEDPILDYAIYYMYAVNGMYPNELTKEKKRAVRK